MAKLIFTPWKSHSHLLSVRDQFYPSPTNAGPDLRPRACATVAAWKLRGNLPHAVEATALLTDAILHDDAAKNSVFSIRATYAAAFCRFVTLLVDSKLHGQRKTMFQRALDLGLPASFVELRHEATHRDLPSLVVLRNSAQRSLEWLWDYYWGKADRDAGRAGPVGCVDGTGDVEAVREAVRGALDVFTGEGEPPRKRRKGFKLQAEVAAQLGEICRTSARGGVVLARVLFDDGILVPKERKLGDSLDTVFTKWERLLMLVVENHPPFSAVLADEMANELAFSSTSDPKNNPLCEGLYLWLDRIMTSAQWEPSRRLLSVAYINAACDANPNHWTGLLRERLRLADCASVDIPSVPQGERPQPGKRPMPDDSAELKKHGWEFLDRWDRTGKGNNYAYLVTDEPTKHAVVIDPANPPEVAPEVNSQIRAGKINLAAIVNTHHHWDHAGGNKDMLQQFGQLPIIGGKNCESVTKTPQHGESFKIGDRISVKALHTPCHTQDSVCYFMEDGDQRVVFTGDTLFIGGCGRFFEGNAQEMHKALNETLAALPDDTRVYPGHEYTKGNVKFCAAVSQSEPIKKLQAFAEKNQQTQGKFTIGDEKLHNVFMRVNDPEIQKVAGKTSPVEVMAKLREMKNAM
ncbi:Hydroxyacylglutathione hydrolase [Aspergillus sp. HF37]|nr:Hydroxyacylglutathione hydrolase [Aspergillus sp. HF37]